jgi:hypothetical protein
VVVVGELSPPPALAALTTTISATNAAGMRMRFFLNQGRDLGDTLSAFVPGDICGCGSIFASDKMDS